MPGTKRETLAFLRILPAGAADVGDVSRDELRAASAGQWAMTDVSRDDLSDVPGLFGDEFEEVLAMEDRATDPRVVPVELRFSGRR